MKEVKKLRLPRKFKKRIKNSRLIMNITSLPEFLTLEQLMNIYQTTGILFYVGEKPQFINL